MASSPRMIRPLLPVERSLFSLLSLDKLGLLSAPCYRLMFISSCSISSAVVMVLEFAENAL